MKKILSKPAVAVILTIIAVCGSIVINTRVRLGTQCDRISNHFYTAYSAEEYSLADSLRTLCNTSEQLIMLGIKYDVQNAEDARGPIEDIRSALRDQSTDASSVFEDYQVLLKDIFDLESSLERAQLSETDAADYASAKHTASELKTGLDNTAYNEEVRRFLKLNGSFPTPQIAKLSGVELPTLFA